MKDVILATVIRESVAANQLLQCRSPLFVTDATWRANSTSFGSPTLRPKFSSTLLTDYYSFDCWGWCDFGLSEITVDAPVAFDTECLQVVNLIGFQIGIETSKWFYMVDLQLDTCFVASLASMVIPLKRLFSLIGPIGTAIPDSPPAPCGAILASHISTNPFPRTFKGTKVMTLKCAFVTGKFFAADITLNNNGVGASLFVWCTLPSAHTNVSFIPDGHISIPELAQSRIREARNADPMQPKIYEDGSKQLSLFGSLA